MIDKNPPAGATSVNLRWLGYLGLALGLGAVVLTVDSGSVSVAGLGLDVAVPIIAAVAFLGGLLGGRYGPTKGDL